jgi:tripartite-type tricarboxylate transporter receptor subunit TctC
MFSTPTLALRQIRAGKIRALAYDHATRASFLPDVPTLAEAGAPSSQLDSSWHGLLGPAKLPASVLARLESEVRKALAAPDVRDRFVTLGLRPIGSTPADFRKVLTNAIQRFAEAAKLAHIQPE